ncbi:MAG: helix-turn-helix domain-containing protein [Ignavibacteria bacterium]|nr:helix-turn-helix domain-containing protein [Ignavibacteria bacterium]
MVKVKSERKNEKRRSLKKHIPKFPHNTTHCLPDKEILQKLSTIEELLKKKDDRPLTFKEACTYLGYAPSYLYKLTYKNVIPHYKPTGKMIFFSKNEVDQWIFSSEERRVKSDERKEEKISEKDPNQVDMFEKRKEEEEEIVIEFPLKSRRAKK